MSLKGGNRIDMGGFGRSSKGEGWSSASSYFVKSALKAAALTPIAFNSSTKSVAALVEEW